MRVPAERVESFLMVSGLHESSNSIKILSIPFKKDSHLAVLLNEPLSSHLSIIKAPEDGSD